MRTSEIYSHESIPFLINFIYKLIELYHVALVFAWVKVNENENENILLVLAPRDVSYRRCDVWYGTELDSLSTLIVSAGF